VRPSGPLPRFRLYTRPALYAEVARELAAPGRGGERAQRRLEQAVAAWAGLPAALCVPRARAGIYLALRALIEPGQQVILSPYTIHEVVNVVLCAGGVPVFADVDRRSGNLDPRAALALLGPGTGAVLVTHLHGLAAEIGPLLGPCRARGVAVVEDCAQAFGTRLAGRPLGTFGDAGILSFGTYKNVTSFLGGMLLTPHAHVRERAAAALAGWPLQPLGPWLREIALGLATDVVTWPPLFRRLTFPLFRYGYLNDVELLNRRVRVEDDPRRRREYPREWSVRMRPAQARMALGQLASLEQGAAARAAFARRYHEGLADLEDHLLLPPLREDGSHGYSYYPIQYADRHALVRFMMQRGCDLAVQHLRNCADLPCFAEFRRDCPNARATAAATVLLPTYPRYGTLDVERNVAAIRAFFGRPRARA
jgi:dTDP-4-amino-4,6-dideoxygalactose transaminase